ncbi:response regulator [Pseudobacteriovorax antillogorgiicola]|uniref:Hpt domain-containing protein n=1 Tax=Pseudobacteriovorax antillogorgiicola TaxID=1513793 RepID=A0A1Y6BS44_9BACT|nr:response regulator [Pseudobacteriovorax antillogorgiicola]TCS54636.1 Hpt domain-containing protein [Pseudobacteriovorax antillogorgiicola]SMF17110.1 Hpt domain-containing protein [Pseudobacteriovorax antillogorgiicola]
MSLAEDYLQFQKELIDTFLAESSEHLEAVEQQLNQWKINQSDDAISDIFRRVHSMKGGSATCGFMSFSESIHLFEDVLKGIAEGNIAYTENLVDDVFQCFDHLTDAVQELLDNGESQSDLNIPPIISKYAPVKSGEAPKQEESPPLAVEQDESEGGLRDQLETFDRPPCVLLCEDDDGFSSMIERILKKEGLKTVLAPSGEAGLDMFKQGGIDFVITDYHLGGITGIDLLENIRNLNPTVPVMVISGQAGINDLAREMLRHDACYFISKPVSVNVLRLGVRQAIKFYYTQKTLEDVCAENFRTFIGCRKLAFGNLEQEKKRQVETDVEASMNRFVRLIERVRKVLSWSR